MSWGPSVGRARSSARTEAPYFVSNGQPIFLPPPLPERLVTGNPLGLRSALAEGLSHRFGQERWCARGLGDRQQLEDAPLGLRDQPAPHGLAIDPQQARHLAARAGLLGPHEREGLPPLLLLRLSRSPEQLLQLRGRFLDRRGTFSWRAAPVRKKVRTGQPLRASCYAGLSTGNGITGKAVRLAQAFAQGWPDRWRQEGRLTWSLGDREHPSDASGRISG
jgi:hypothetical protein